LVIVAGQEISAQLNGKDSSDPDGSIKSFAWSLSSGPTSGAVIKNPASDVTTVTFTQVGAYVFKLIVTDDQGATDSATTSVSVTRIENKPPVAVAKSEPASLVFVAGQEISAQLNGKDSSDPDGSIKSFAWSLSSGPTSGAVIKSPASEITVVSFTQPGVYVFKLVVTDDQGATDTATTSISVIQADNKPPVAVAFAEPNVVALSADGQGVSKLSGIESSDPDGEIKSFAWSLSSGPTSGAVIKSPASEITDVSFTQPGVYVFKLVVTDDKGAPDTTTTSISVTQEDNRPPVAVATAKPSTLLLVPDQQFTVQLEGSGSSAPVGSIKSFSWKLSSGPASAKIVAPAQSSSVVQFFEPGNYSFSLTVTDSRGKSSTAQTTVSVSQEAVTQKTCALLDNILVGFTEISSSDKPEIVRAFATNYADFKEINTFFNQMKSSNVVNMSLEAKVEFFIEHNTELQLQKWIKDLLLVFPEFSELRTLSLLTLNTLTELAYYISCIQAEDMNKAKVKMGGVLTSVLEILQSIAQQIGIFNGTHKKILSGLASFTNDERVRVKNNGEESKKPAYGKMLVAILNAFKPMNL
jgi:PKD repeat protein